MEDGPRAEGQGGEVTVGRAGLGGEIQKGKEKPVSGHPHGGAGVGGWAGEAGGDGRAGPQRALFARSCGAEGAVWARGGGGWRGRAGGLSPVLRVGSFLRGHRGQRGDRGDSGQGRPWCC